jgi:hypothetical protein
LDFDDGFRRRRGRGRRRGDDLDFFLDGRGLGFYLGGLGGEAGGDGGVGLDDFFLKPFGADFIERAGWNLGGGNVQFLGLRDDFLALETESFRNVVYTNGHKFFSLPPAGRGNLPAWLKSQKQNHSN